MIEVEARLLKAAAVEAAAVAASGADAVPILANVLIDADQSGLRLCATDMDMALDRHVELMAGARLKTTVSAKLLAAIADKLPPEARVTLDLEQGSKLVVKAGRSRFTLAVLAPEEFPEFPAEEWAAEFEMAAADLGNLIDALAFAVSTEETRYYLNGIFFHRVDEPGGEMLMRCAATDGHRLARYQLPLPDGAETLPSAGVIVPRRALGVIRKLCSAAEEGGKIALSISERRIRFAAGETVLTAKLIDGQFPDYSRVIPTANDRHLTIDKAALKEAAERVTAIATDKTRTLAMKLAKDVATLTVTSLQNGTAVEEVPACYEAEELTVGFNARYLGGVLARIRGDMLTAEFADPQAPVLLRDPACDRQIFVLMPMRA